MANFVPANNVTSAGVPGSIGNDEYFYVLRSISVVGTGEAGIYAVGINDYGYVSGSVFGADVGINVAALYSGHPSGNLTTIDIAAGGEVIGDRIAGIDINATNSTINNAGTILSRAVETGSGVEWYSNGNGVATLNNSGIIQSGEIGIIKTGTEKFVLTNTGTIRGTNAAFYSAASQDVIYNQGKMFGSISMGAENDLYDGRGGTQTGAVNGGTGRDTLYGGSGADSLNGDGDSDFIRGGAGKDTMNGGDSTTDLVDYSDKTTKVVLTLKGATASVVTVNGVAEDTIYNFEYVKGGSTGDVLTGDGQGNFLWGQAGNDTLIGGSGNDTVMGGTGADSMDGGIGVDALDYSDKTTGVVVVLTGATYATVTVGGVAEDKVANFEQFFGGSGADKVTGDAGANWFVGNSGNDTLDGGAGNDTLVGGIGNDSLLGGIGNDSLSGGAGNDTMDGGAGFDRIDYSDRLATIVTLNGATLATVTIGGVAEDKIANIEQLTGGTGSDKFIGDAGNNLFVGNFGNDTLSGGAGSDTLIGGTGLDSLTGGADADHFRFAYPTDIGGDHITDFVHGTDRLEITGASHLGPVGQLNAALFSSVASGNTGDGVNDYFIYDRSTGNLWYDAVPNATVNGDHFLVATLDNKPATFSSTDIWLL